MQAYGSLGDSCHLVKTDYRDVSAKARVGGREGEEIRSAEAHSAGRRRIVWAKETEILSRIQITTARKGAISKYPTITDGRRTLSP